MEYTVSAKKLRPLPNNDSQKPLSERRCGALVAGRPEGSQRLPQIGAGELGAILRPAVHFFCAGQLAVSQTALDSQFECMAHQAGARVTGEPVECLWEGGWWEGFVHCIYDDHITVFFPGAHA